MGSACARRRCSGYRRLGRTVDAARALADFQRISDAKRTARYLSARLSLEPNNAELRRHLAQVQAELEGRTLGR